MCKLALNLVILVSFLEPESLFVDHCVLVMLREHARVASGLVREITRPKLILLATV